MWVVFVGLALVKDQEDEEFVESEFHAQDLQGVFYMAS